MNKPIRLSCHNGYNCKSQFWLEWRSFSSPLCSTPSAARRWRWPWNRWLLAGRWRKEELSPTLIHWTFIRTFLSCKTIRDEVSQSWREDLQKRTTSQEFSLVFKLTLFKFKGTVGYAKCIAWVVYKGTLSFVQGIKKEKNVVCTSK